MTTNDTVEHKKWKTVLLLAVMAKVVAGAVTGVTTGGAQLPGAGGLVFTRV